MREILQILHKRIQVNAATILVKVKSHRGEPMNEYADTAANEGRQASDDSAQWNETSGRMFSPSRKGMRSDTPPGRQASKELSRRKRGNEKFNCSYKKR